MSEVFTDYGPEEDDYRRIAQRLIESGYSDTELRIVFWTKVAPALIGNWILSHFNTTPDPYFEFCIECVESKILKRRGGWYWFKRLVLVNGSSYIRSSWRVILQYVDETRQGG